MRLPLIALTLLLGCQRAPGTSPLADDLAEASTPANATLEAGLTDRIWILVDPAERPGVMRLFLSDGTLLMDSCWETYRLSRWTLGPDQVLRWQEDNQEVQADVLSLNVSQLTLRLRLGSDTPEQRSVPASVPYVCPDIPR